MNFHHFQWHLVVQVSRIWRNEPPRYFLSILMESCLRLRSPSSRIALRYVCNSLKINPLCTSKHGSSTRSFHFLVVLSSIFPFETPITQIPLTNSFRVNFLHVVQEKLLHLHLHDFFSMFCMKLACLEQLLLALKTFLILPPVHPLLLFLTRSLVSFAICLANWKLVLITFSRRRRLFLLSSHLNLAQSGNCSDSRSVFCSGSYLRYAVVASFHRRDYVQLPSPLWAVLISL